MNKLEQLNQEAIRGIEQLIKDAKLNMSTDEFIEVYASNRGISKKALNVWNNIKKYQLYFEGNFKYLYKILGDKLNFLNENPKYYRYGDAQYKASQKYKKENIVRLVISLNKNTDKDILDQVNKQDNKQGYIKELIRRDI